jgi:hypothetical protein
MSHFHCLHSTQTKWYFTAMQKLAEQEHSTFFLL